MTFESPALSIEGLAIPPSGGITPEGSSTYIVSAGVVVACHIRQTLVEPGMMYVVMVRLLSGEGFLCAAACLVGARQCDPTVCRKCLSKRRHLRGLVGPCVGRWLCWH